MKALIFFLLVINASIVFSQRRYPDVFLTKEFKGIIFGKTNNPFCLQSAYDLKRTEVIEAEKAVKINLDSLVDDFNKVSKVKILIKPKFENYKRQYFGCLRDGMKKTVIITFDYVENVNEINWNFKEVMQFEDGGDNHWLIKYDLNTKKIVSFSVNSDGG